MLDYSFIQAHTLDNIDKGTISPSEIHGLGLFATVDIAVDNVLCNLDGQIVSWEKYNAIQSNVTPFILEPYPKYLFMEWNALDKETLLVRSLRTKYSFINHSRTPNAKIVRDDANLQIITTSDIASSSEITLDYRNEPLNDKYVQKYGLSYL